MRKKLFCIILAVSILLCTNVIYTSAATDSGYCGKGVAWSFDSGDGTLVISGAGRIDDYENISQTPWYTYRDGIVNLKIENGIEYIGNNAFASLTNLENVSCADSVKATGKDILYNTKWLEASSETFVTLNGILIKYNGTGNNVVLPENVTGLGGSVFENNSELTTVISEYSIDTVSDNAFQNCENLESVRFNSLKKLSDGVFENCTSLTEINLSKNLDFIGSSCFLNTGWLNSSKEDFSSVSNILVDYKGRGGIVTVPEHIKGIANAFSFNSDIETVYLPDGLIYIGADAFAGCDNLSCIVFGNGLQSIGKAAFINCISLQEIFFPDSLKTIDENAFEKCNLIMSIKFSENLQKIGRYAFASCSSIETVVLPQTLTSVGDYAFINCDFLTEIFASAQTQFGLRSVGYLMNNRGITKINSIELNGPYNSGIHEYALDNVMKFSASNCTHNFTRTEIAPSCDCFGYDYMSCNVCGYVKYENIKEPTKHSFSEWTLNDEIYERTCSVCREREYDRTVCYDGWAYSYTTDELEVFGEISQTSEFEICKENAVYLYITGNDNIDFSGSENLSFVCVNGEHNAEMFNECDFLENMLISWKPDSDRFILFGDYENQYIYGFDNLPDGAEKMNSIKGTGAEFSFVSDNWTLASAVGVVLGDLNSDGIADGTDAVLANVILAGLIDETEENGAMFKAADCNRNGTVDDTDVLSIIRSGVFLEKIV